MTDLIQHFDELHAAEADPWDVTTRWYERRKRALTMAALPRERYRCAFEPGCSIGANTELLAARCDRVQAMDAASSAVERCRRRLRGAPNVTVTVGALPRDWPDEQPDLVLLSEVLYYLDPVDVVATLDACASSVAPGGHVVAVHWTRVADDFRTPGAEVHRALAERTDLISVARYRDADVRLDVLERPA